MWVSFPLKRRFNFTKRRFRKLKVAFGKNEKKTKQNKIKLCKVIQIFG
jgi:hypothetical protein